MSRVRLVPTLNAAAGAVKAMLDDGPMLNVTLWAAAIWELLAMTALKVAEPCVVPALTVYWQPERVMDSNRDEMCAASRQTMDRPPPMLA